MNTCQVADKHELHQNRSRPQCAYLHGKTVCCERCDGAKRAVVASMRVSPLSPLLTERSGDITELSCCENYSILFSCWAGTAGIACLPVSHERVQM